MNPSTAEPSGTADFKASRVAYSPAIRKGAPGLPRGMAKFILYFGLPSLSTPSSDMVAVAVAPASSVDIVPIENCGVLPVKPIAPDISTRNSKSPSALTYNFALSGSSTSPVFTNTKSPSVISGLLLSASMLATEAYTFLIEKASPLV